MDITRIVPQSSYNNQLVLLVTTWGNIEQRTMSTGSGLQSFFALGLGLS